MSRIPRKVRENVILAAKNRCGYCQTPQDIVPIPFEIEHILPKAAGGTDDEENLWLSCGVCNSFKHAKTHSLDPQTDSKIRLFNPRRQIWKKHFEFSSDNSEIRGKTACGRATVIALKLNNRRAVRMRRLWVSVGWFPPED